MSLEVIWRSRLGSRVADGSLFWLWHGLEGKPRGFSPVVFLVEGPKAKALGYLDAKAFVTLLLDGWLHRFLKH
jgi:hypothetical protein